MDVNRELRRVARDATDLDDARRRLDVLLRRAVGYDVGSFATVDPATELWTSCYVSGLDAAGSAERERTLYELELAGDLNTFAELGRRDLPVATLHASTDGVLPRARRWEPLLETFGVVDEVRGVLRTGGNTWGVLALYRCGTSAPFSPADIAVLARALPEMAALFRLMLMRLALVGAPEQPLPPGGFTISADGSLTGVSASARTWLDNLDDRGRLPAAIRAVAGAARAGSRHAVVSIPSRRGGFVTLHGSLLEDTEDVSVVIEPARAGVVSDLLAHAYALTNREREVAAQSTLGMSTRDIARTLAISPFTVNDHLKSLYRKVGVNSRSELVAALHTPDHGRLRADEGPHASWYLDHNVVDVRSASAR